MSEEFQPYVATVKVVTVASSQDAAIASIRKRLRFFEDWGFTRQPNGPYEYPRVISEDAFDKLEVLAERAEQCESTHPHPCPNCQAHTCDQAYNDAFDKL